jgi:hypothetical protein
VVKTHLQQAGATMVVSHSYELAVASCCKDPCFSSMQLKKSQLTQESAACSKDIVFGSVCLKRSSLCRGALHVPKNVAPVHLACTLIRAAQLHAQGKKGVRTGSVLKAALPN